MQDGKSDACSYCCLQLRLLAIYKDSSREGKLIASWLVGVLECGLMSVCYNQSQVRGGLNCSDLEYFVYFHLFFTYNLFFCQVSKEAILIYFTGNSGFAVSHDLHPGAAPPQFIGSIV